jgi:toxin ParE1/3/4
MAVAQISAKAQEDIDAIADRIARDKPLAALKWIDRLHERFDVLADWPGAGQIRDDLQRGLRTLPFGNYIICYRVTADGDANRPRRRRQTKSQ